jgi:hypothetical protein
MRFYFLSNILLGSLEAENMTQQFRGTQVQKGGSFQKVSKNGRQVETAPIVSV